MEDDAASPVRLATSVRAGSSRPERRRVLVWCAAALVAAALVADVVARATGIVGGHPGGDPGGRVLVALTPVVGLDPPGSTVVALTRRDAVWSAACPDNPSGRAGWSGVEVSDVFVSTMPAPELLAEVDRALETQGWRPTPPVDESAWQYAPVAEWRKSVPGTTSARAAVFAYPAGVVPSAGLPGTTWFLGAEGKTPGFALPGC